MCTLEFWKKWQNHLPGLAKIANNAACERMFSTAGNIFSLKIESTTLPITLILSNANYQM